MKKIFALFVLFVLFVAESRAQPGFDDDVEDAPLSGIGYLIIAAICLGVYSVYKIKKQQKNIITV